MVAPANGTVKLIGSEVCGGKERSDGSDDKRDCFYGVRLVLHPVLCVTSSHHDCYVRGLVGCCVGRVWRGR